MRFHKTAQTFIQWKPPYRSTPGHSDTIETLASCIFELNQRNAGVSFVDACPRTVQWLIIRQRQYRLIKRIGIIIVYK